MDCQHRWERDYSLPTHDTYPVTYVERCALCRATRRASEKLDDDLRTKQSDFELDIEALKDGIAKGAMTFAQAKDALDAVYQRATSAPPWTGGKRYGSSHWAPRLRWVDGTDCAGDG